MSGSNPFAGVSSPSIFVRRRKTLIGVVVLTWILIVLLFFASHYSSSGLQVPSIFDPTSDNADDEWYHRLLGNYKSRPQGAFGGTVMDNFADRQCGDNYAHTNPDHTRDYIRKWTSMTDSTVIAWRHKWQKYIASPQVKDGYAKGNFQGRGILFTAGNKDTYDRVMTTLRILRVEYKCNLPAEVWYFKGELTDVQIENLKELQAIARDLSDPSNGLTVQKDKGAWKNFQIKSTALINSRFKEILYLDSDNVPLRDPQYLFDSADYKKTGALFWPDYWKTHPSNPIWKIMDVDCQGDWEQEAGQMVINKQMHWEPLQLSYHMQAESAFYFKLVMGDKDTFRFAWKALKHQYAYPSRFVSAAGIKTGPDKRFCGHTMLQYDFNSRPLFVHANLVKLLPADALPRSSETWAVVKRYTKDTDRAHARIAMWYHMGGICIDFLPEYDPRSWKTNGGNGAWWSDYRNKFGDGHGDPPKPGESELELLTFDEISGKEFEEAYWRHGGVGGGKGVFDGKIDPDEARRKAEEKQEAEAKTAKATATPDITSDEKLAAETENERDAWKEAKDAKHAQAQ